MNIGLSSRLFGLVVFCVLACIPLKAQETMLYAQISDDGYGNLSGISWVDIGSYSPMWEAYVQGEIDGPSGTYAAGPGFDNGSGYAEVVLYAAADFDGGYDEITDGSMATVFGEYYLGYVDSGDIDFTGDCVPSGEYSTFLQLDYLIGGGGYGADFQATLTGGYFAGDTIGESVILIGQSCAIPGVTIYAPPSPPGPRTTTVQNDNYYIDIIGQPGFMYPNYYQGLLNSGLNGIPGPLLYQGDACNLFVDYQDIWDLSSCDPMEPFKYNVLQFTVYPFTMYVTRDGVDAEVE